MTTQQTAKQGAERNGAEALEKPLGGEAKRARECGSAESRAGSGVSTFWEFEGSRAEGTERRKPTLSRFVERTSAQSERERRLGGVQRRASAPVCQYRRQTVVGLLRLFCCWLLRT